MPAQYIASRKLHTHHHLTTVPMSSQLIRQTPRVSQCPIDHRRRERSNHLPVSATYYRETDASFNLLLARHGPHMHECMNACMHTAAAPSPKVICSSCRRVQQYVSSRHSTFPLGYLVMHFLWMGRPGTRLERRVRVSCTCTQDLETMFELLALSKRQVQVRLMSQHLAVSDIKLNLLSPHPLCTSKLAMKCLLQINLTGFPNLAKRRCRHANASKPPHR
jgi:hypothetical protein